MLRVGQLKFVYKRETIIVTIIMVVKGLGHGRVNELHILSCDES